MVGSGASRASLHAKTNEVDRQRLYVGSFNFDPRSVALNCEMGFLVQSPRLVEFLDAVFDRIRVEDEAAKAWYARVKSRPSFRPLLVEMHAGVPPSKTYADLDF